MSRPARRKTPTRREAGCRSSRIESPRPAWWSTPCCSLRFFSSPPEVCCGRHRLGYVAPRFSPERSEEKTMLTGNSFHLDLHGEPSSCTTELRYEDLEQRIAPLVVIAIIGIL